MKPTEVEVTDPALVGYDENSDREDGHDPDQDPNGEGTEEGGEEPQPGGEDGKA